MTGFHFVNDPVHGGFAHGFKLAEPALGGVGHVFAEPLVALVAAFDAHYDHGFVPAQEKFLHAPGFAIGGILVPKQIVAVEKVHDRVAFCGVVIVFRQPDVEAPVGTLGGIDKVALEDHKRSP